MTMFCGPSLSSSRLAGLVVALTLLLGTCRALEVVNKRSCSITVFAPPICEPCKCPQIQCIRAPCEQPPCFCPAICKFVPGVAIKSGGAATLAVAKEDFPLQFLTVEIGKAAYVVNETDLQKEIVSIATVKVTDQACGTGYTKKGIVALVYKNPKFVGFQTICLLPGERYGK